MNSSILFVWDLDGTIYLRKEQFDKANKKLFGVLPPADYEKLYLLFEKNVDETFYAHASGDITLEQMHILRIQKTLESAGIHIDANEARQWQSFYEYYQKKIQLCPEMKELFDFLFSKNIRSGLISNGKTQGQRHKLDLLGLSLYLDPELIVISEEAGVSKPDTRIFEFFMQKLGSAEVSEIYYIGDNYVADIESSHCFGWKNIWCNFKIENLTGNLVCDYEARNHKELSAVIKQLVLEQYRYSAL